MTVASASRDSRPDLTQFVEHVVESLAQGGRLRLETDEQTYELDGPSGELLTAVLRVLARGQAVDIVALPEELTTGQAADLLQVSRPTVVKLVDSGVIPSRRIATHRRIRTADVLAYRERARRERGAALNELTELSQELGLYDEQ